MDKKARYILILFLFVFASCSVTKYVPKDQFLLDEVKIVTDQKAINPSTLYPYLKQKTNYRVFTLFRSQLRFYSLSGRDTTSWFNRFLKKLGEPPVIYDENLIEKSREDIEKSVINKGFLNVSVIKEIKKYKKKAQVILHVNAQRPFRIRSYTTLIGIDKMAQIINKDSSNSLLKPGVIFDRSVLDAERQRVVTLLRHNGYFSITKDRLSFIADTSLNSNKVDLTMQLFFASKHNANEKMSTDQCQYRIKNVYIVTEYDPTMVSDSLKSHRDTVLHKGYHIVYAKKKWIRPEVLTSSCYIMPNQIYDERQVDLTYNSFSRLKAVKYVNLRFETAGIADSCQLNCYLLLSSAKPQSVSTEIEGTNSAGDLGIASTITYQHRNIFNGSEIFSAKVRGAYERLSGIGVNSNFMELGSEVGLSFPKFVFPFIDYNLKRRVRAISELIGSYNFQQRPEYTRVISGATWRYKWNTRNATNRHSLDLIDASYVFLPWISSGFLSNNTVINPLLLYNYQNHFIMRTGYTYYLSNQNNSKNQRNIYTLRVGAETAGNTLNAFSRLTNATKVGDYYQFLGVTYSQYAKAEIDFANTRMLDKSNSLAYHANIGFAFPYGNSQILPFEKRYFAGGANSVRGWSVRSLGPGIFKQSNNTADFVSHAGDVKLDLSLEFRSKLFWIVESALFVDAGNIWTIKNYDEIQNGGLFKFDSFYNQIALAYGLGIRLNFSYFVFRVDLGLKAYDPAQNGLDRWRHPRIGNGESAWHFAVGYPF